MADTKDILLADTINVFRSSINLAASTHRGRRQCVFAFRLAELQVATADG
jgi:hypothetical protein